MRQEYSGRGDQDVECEPDLVGLTRDFISIGKRFLIGSLCLQLDPCNKLSDGEVGYSFAFSPSRGTSATAETKLNSAILKRSICLPRQKA